MGLAFHYLVALIILKNLRRKEQRRVIQGNEMKDVVLKMRGKKMGISPSEMARFRWIGKPSLGRLGHLKNSVSRIMNVDYKCRKAMIYKQLRSYLQWAAVA